MFWRWDFAGTRSLPSPQRGSQGPHRRQGRRCRRRSCHPHTATTAKGRWRRRYGHGQAADTSGTSSPARPPAQWATPRRRRNPPSFPSRTPAVSRVPHHANVPRKAGGGGGGGGSYSKRCPAVGPLPSPPVAPHAAARRAAAGRRCATARVPVRKWRGWGGSRGHAATGSRRHHRIGCARGVGVARGGLSLVGHYARVGATVAPRVAFSSPALSPPKARSSADSARPRSALPFQGRDRREACSAPRPPLPLRRCYIMRPSTGGT